MRELVSLGLTLLGRQDRSREDLRRRLLAKGSPQDVEEALRHLQKAGFIDDGQYARRTVERAIVRGGASVRALEAKLARHGVERAQASAALDEARQAEAASAVTYAERVDRADGKSLPEVRAKRLAGKLLRAGYPLSVVRAVMEQRLPEVVDALPWHEWVGGDDLSTL